ncbi:MAG: hypothetical protein COU63_02130 [Candidatus Pacebacteria bacterium CG10_big_fil_rev_8_21_14_0_10_36_11]|nr:MAG: hypothetical protein AUK08_03595 [Candidatus Pacebacteria bacterium CG2_30_36_39]PIR64793.1 MAG: hypothetical protein COU63_02130 [Candidatus Pacebacteria bacterium CG10_big_fil_rev_8_21_14_0_10_36_11]
MSQPIVPERVTTIPTNIIAMPPQCPPIVLPVDSRFLALAMLIKMSTKPTTISNNPPKNRIAKFITSSKSTSHPEWVRWPFLVNSAQNTKIDILSADRQRIITTSFFKELTAD